jgi:16S rRNA (guanine527-N7)-methyltransferase
VSRLDEVGRRFGLSEHGIAALRAILLLQAEDPTVSTTVRDPEAAADRHVADSLVALEIPAVRAGRRVADIGSGAGWPGLALAAAALPSARVALVESAVRHCRYLERAVAASGLTNADVVHARVEEWEAGFNANDIVTARALAALPVVVEYAAPLLAEGGHLVAWKGEIDANEAKDGGAAAQAVGLEAVEVRDVDPYPHAGRRTLHVFRKIAPTPPRFPRRPGMAVKRPLGAGSGRSAR